MTEQVQSAEIKPWRSCSELRRENEMLRAALRIYANPRLYDAVRSGSCDCDMTQWARDALATCSSQVGTKNARLAEW